MSSNQPPRSTDAPERMASQNPGHNDRTGGGESLEEVLARARGHAQTALTEALASILALLEAVSLASSGEFARANGILAPAARVLESLRNQFGETDRESIHLIQSIAEALDTEIIRWEERARNDSDARSVLRAFLGLRELLWEFGVRTESTPQTPDKRSGAKKPKTKPSSKRKNVQRIVVEG